MIDHLDPLAGVAHHFQVGDVARDQLDGTAHRRQIRHVARAEVVEHAHLVAARHERLGQVRANEPGASGDQTQRHDFSKRPSP
jgi:hypothetical protein